MLIALQKVIKNLLKKLLKVVELSKFSYKLCFHENINVTITQVNWNITAEPYIHLGV